MLFVKVTILVVLMSMGDCYDDDDDDYDNLGIRSWHEITGLWHVVAVTKITGPVVRMPHCWTLDIVQPRWHSDIIKGVSIFYETTSTPYVVYFTATRFLTTSGFDVTGSMFESVEYRQITVKIRGQGTLAVDMIRHESSKANETSRIVDMIIGGMKQNYFDELYISRRARLPKAMHENVPIDMYVVDNTNCSYY